MTKEKTQKTKTPKPKYNMWQCSAFMISTAWKAKEKKVIVLSVLVALFGVATQVVNLLVTPAILSAIERQVSIGELLLTIGGSVGAIMLTSAALRYVDLNSSYGRLAVREEILALLVKKNMSTSYSNLNDKKYDELMNKSQTATQSNWESAELIWKSMTDLLKNVIGFVIYASLLTSVKPMLLFVILVTAVISYFVNNYVSGYFYRHRDEETSITKKLRYIINIPQNYAAAKDIRIFGLRSWFEELGRKAMNAYMAFYEKAAGVYMLASILDLVLAFLRNGIAYFYLISLVLGGEIGAAEFLLFFTAVEGFSAWVTGVLSTLNTFYKQSLDISTVRECLDYEEPFKFEDGESLIHKEGAEYELRLENISFRYPGAEKDTLKNINLTLHPGEKLAIVGLNGAGKTTLVKVMCGFFDPTEGRVLLNGKDIRDYNREHYYRLFSAVFQDFSIIATTVAANVVQNDENIDMEKVKDCIEKAGLTEKINSLPKSYETLMNREVYEDAVMLSGGETQRLMLARALYKDAPFVVLDEPTAALDPIAESDLYQKYNSMTAHKSSVYISHRLASTRFCDRIILIDGSKIAEEGTHDSLLKMGGKYAELYAVQSKYYQNEGGSSDEK